jgi:hypothetical protein
VTILHRIPTLLRQTPSTVKTFAARGHNRPHDLITGIQHLTGCIINRIRTAKHFDAPHNLVPQHRGNGHAATSLNAVQIAATQRAPDHSHQHFTGLRHRSPEGLQLNTAWLTGKHRSQRLT